MLEIKVKSPNSTDALDQIIEKLHSYIRELFPSAQVMEQFGERVQYKVLKSDVVSLAKTFSVLERGMGSI